MSNDGVTMSGSPSRPRLRSRVHFEGFLEEGARGAGVTSVPEDTVPSPSDEPNLGIKAAFEDDRAVSSRRQTSMALVHERRRSAAAASRERQLSMLMPISAAEGGFMGSVPQQYGLDAATQSASDMAVARASTVRGRVLATLQSAGQKQLHAGKRFMRGDKHVLTDAFRSISTDVKPQACVD